jgi:hypothetical protein
MTSILPILAAGVLAFYVQVKRSSQQWENYQEKYVQRQMQAARSARVPPTTAINSNTPAGMQKAAAPSVGAVPDLQVPLLSAAGADLPPSSRQESVKIDMVD